MLQGKALLVTLKMNADEWVEVAELQSTQDEADTRFLLHALHAAITGLKAVIVIAEDTDGMLLYLAFQNDIHCPIYQKCGTQNRTRFSTSANWHGHCETASVIATLGYMPLQAMTP